MTDRKKPGVAFWATVGLVVVLVEYPLSMEPACWIGWPRYLTLDAIARVYQPILWIDQRSPKCVRDGISWYISLGLRGGDKFTPAGSAILKIAPY